MPEQVPLTTILSGPTHTRAVSAVQLDPKLPLFLFAIFINFGTGEQRGPVRPGEEEGMAWGRP